MFLDDRDDLLPAGGGVAADDVADVAVAQQRLAPAAIGIERAVGIDDHGIERERVRGVSVDLADGEQRSVAHSRPIAA